MRDELSGIHFKVTILNTALWIPACASMTVSCAAFIWLYPKTLQPVIPEMRDELSGIYFKVTILSTALWIPACASMTV